MRVEGAALCLTVGILHEKARPSAARVLQMNFHDVLRKQLPKEQRRKRARRTAHLNGQIPEMRLRFAAQERVDFREQLHVILVVD